MIVVDSNVLAARMMVSTKTPFAEEVDRIDNVWIVPPLWRYEFQNILAKVLWARQLTTEGAFQVWRVTVTRMAENEKEPSPENVIDLAGRHRITAYDANFIALAKEMGVQCVTEDGELSEKFPGIAVNMADFARQSPSRGEVREAHVVYRTRKRK
jgi:predicted nucleic acid-binding protein